MEFNHTNSNAFHFFPIKRFLTDVEVSLISPIAVYWAHSLTYHAFDEFQLFQNYKLMPKEEEEKNRASKYEVVKHIAIYHSFLLAIGYVALGFEPEESQLDDPLGFTSWLLRFLGAEALSMRRFPVMGNMAYVLVLGIRLGMAMVVYDTWQFWVHYFMHVIPWIYKHIHSTHHRLYAPYSFGALYMHPIEAIMLDVIGPMITYTLIGLVPRERTVLFVLGTVKTVNDHSGYVFPWDPVIILGKLTGCDIVYHTIHHQTWGIKTNYALFFTFWDHWMNTYYRGSKRLNSIETNKKAASTVPGEEEEHRVPRQARSSKEVSAPLSSERAVAIETILQKKLTSGVNNVRKVQ